MLVKGQERIFVEGVLHADFRSFYFEIQATGLLISRVENGEHHGLLVKSQPLSPPLRLPRPCIVGTF